MVKATAIMVIGILATACQSVPENRNAPANHNVKAPAKHCGEGDFTLTKSGKILCRS